MQNEIFRQSAFELGEQAVAFTESSRSKLSQTTEQTHIHQIDFECGQVVVGGNRKAGSGAAVDFMHQSGINKPLQSILIFTRTCAFFYDFIDKFLVFSRQLGWQRLPNH